ncbi:D-alanyl-D-alanine carboxypeptidase [Streptomyces chattanoogensis]
MVKETSVAGESPDRSDKKQSSGETARSERDPRLSVFRGEPDAPAKDEEAAGAAADAEGAGTEGADARAVEAAPEKGSEASQGAAGGEDGAGEGAGDGEDRPRAAEAVEADGDGRADEAEGGAGDEGADGGEGGEPEADAEVTAEAGPEAAKKADEAKPKADEAKPEADEAKPKAASKADAKAGAKADAKGSEPEGAGAESEGADAEPEVVDQPTAVFKTLDARKGKGGDKAEADEAPVDEATRVFAIAKSKGKGAAGQTVDQPTTAFKITPPAKGKDTDKAKDKAEEEPQGKGKNGSKAGDSAKAEDKPKADDKPEAGDKAKPGATKDGDKPAAPKAKPAERDTERTSQFVALKSADDGAAGKSLGKTADRTPARTPGKTLDKAAPAKGSGALPPEAPAAPAAPRDEPAALPESERTKQEPLPPLDLLAKLTNTPPPPETPLRTVVRRFKIWTPLAILLAVIFVVVQAVRPLPAPAVVLGDAKSSFTFEGDKLSIPWPEHGQAAVKVVGAGEVGTFGEQKPVPTASVAKIMTAYVILKEHPLKKDETGPKIEVDEKAVTEGGSRDESRIKGLQAGQKFSQQDMIKMLMIPSGNNIARLLARWDTQSANEGAFVKKMNDAAKDLGMKNTTYTDPSGLDPKTVSTAVDQLKLAEAVMKFDAFRPIVAMPNAEIPGLPERIYNNNGSLLLAGLSIKGIKTGSSTAAGGTLSWAAYKTVDGKDRLILGTMMGQHFKGLDPDGSNSLTMVKSNSQKVIATVRTALTSATAVKKGQVVGYVDDGLDGLTPVVATKDLTAVGVPGQKLVLSIGDGGKALPHEAKAGTKVGVLTVGSGSSAQKVPVALQKDLTEPTFGAKLTRLG